MPVAITTSTFGKVGSLPFDLLDKAGISYTTNPYGRKLGVEETIKLLTGCEGVIAGTELYTEEVLDALPTLRVISRVGVGMNSIDVAAAKARGITVANTPDAHVDAVAELTLAGILAARRHLAETHHALRDGTWARPMGGLLSGSTVGLIGAGRVGRRLAELLRPFHVDLLLFDRDQDLSFADRVGGRYVDLDHLLRAAQVACVLVPLTDETYRMLGHDELKRMRSDALLVNTSRGGLIDEEALLSVLNERTDFHAYLDVFEEEPYDGPLLRHPRVTATAHMGGYAREGRLNMETQAVENLLSHL